MAAPAPALSQLPAMDGYSTFMPAAHQQWETVPAQSLPTHLGLGQTKSFSSMLDQENPMQSQYPDLTRGGMQSSAGKHNRSAGFLGQSLAPAPSGFTAPPHDFSRIRMTDSPTSCEQEGQQNLSSSAKTGGWASLDPDSRSSSAASWQTSQSTDRDSLPLDQQSEDFHGWNPAASWGGAPQQTFAFSGPSAGTAGGPTASFHQPWRQIDPQFPLMPVITSALPATSNRRVSTPSFPMDDAEDDDDDDDDEQNKSSSRDNTAKRKDRYNRRQGVTCDQCRDKHIRCDLGERATEAARPGQSSAAYQGVACTRCSEKGYKCTRTNATPSRRYPRPSRTGKRIEQAR